MVRSTAVSNAQTTWRQVMSWRVRRHGLERRSGDRLEDVAARLCGLHAQLMNSAELAVLARTEAIAQGDLERALWEERSLVKTWAMRGTLHLLPSADYGLWAAALDTRRHYLGGAWLRGFAITAADLERLIAAMAEALDGEPLAREDLAVRVTAITGSEALGDKVRDSWGDFLKPASYRGHHRASY